MDFARKQMEKYGWTDGKGLGKNENGISQALKPKLKQSVTGVGHDAAADFTDHWWSALYDKAAKNVEVKEKNGVTKKIHTKDNDSIEITNSLWRLNRKRNTNQETELYQDYFVKKSVLTKGSKVENVRDTDSEEETEKGDVMKLTDEELFAACEGRTAHKGARHGLKASGKLARIAQQEAMLLSQPKYNGYSHAKKKENSKAVKMDLNPEVKKRKRRASNTDINENGNTDEHMSKESDSSDSILQDGATIEILKTKTGRKDLKNTCTTNESSTEKSKKKKKKAESIEHEETVLEQRTSLSKKKKRKIKNME